MQAEVVCVGTTWTGYLRASQLGVKTIFVDSNQGLNLMRCNPDYFAHRSGDILKGVEALA